MTSPENQNRLGAESIEQQSEQNAKQESSVQKTPTLEEWQKIIWTTDKEIKSGKDAVDDINSQLHQLRSSVGLPDVPEVPHSVRGSQEHVAHLEQKRDAAEKVVSKKSGEAQEIPQSKEVDLPMKEVGAFSDAVDKLVLTARRQEDIESTPLFDNRRLGAALNGFKDLTAKQKVDPQDLGQIMNRMATAINTPPERMNMTRYVEEEIGNLAGSAKALDDIGEASLALRRSSLADDPEKAEPIFAALRRISDVAEHKANQTRRRRGSLSGYIGH